MEEKDFQYMLNEYFNSVDTFTFQLNCGRVFESKCHFHNGNWFTDEGLNWKCTSIKTLK